MNELTTIGFVSFLHFLLFCYVQREPGRCSLNMFPDGLIAEISGMSNLVWVFLEDSQGSEEHVYFVYLKRRVRVIGT